MTSLLGWVPALPLLGFLILLASMGRMPRLWATLVGVGSIGLAALTTGIIAVQFLTGDGQPVTVVLWQWLSVGGFQPEFAFYLDGLTLSMMMVITGVGFLIHLYAAGYMAEDPDFTRFFIYMNLFVCAMLILVMADNLMLLFLGWEGVGLCSYLLIGFWYKNPENGYAARKAFIVTRVGDTAMAIGLFLLFAEVGTLNIQGAMTASVDLWPNGSETATLIAFLLIGGAVGKSAQLPLQTWLPDAMAGPTPISALIHAATMVTAGVYLIARTHDLFLLSEQAMYAVAVIGLATLLLSGTTALVQRDIKRVLAYSTVSQIGYMFLALGVGAWSSAIFHLMTHAFFKALLFLTAGSIILAVHHEQDIFKMGGLRKELKGPFIYFLIGCVCLTALPLTSGFFSKEEILASAWVSPTNGQWLWAGGVLGAFLTSVYTFRMFFIVFYGEQNTKPHEPQGYKFHLPLIVLSVLALVGGFFHLPLGEVFPHLDHHAPLVTEIIAVSVSLLGIALAYYLFYLKPQAGSQLGLRFVTTHRFLFSGWGFDAIYHALLIAPFQWLASINRNDLVDWAPKMAVLVGGAGHRGVSFFQNGQLRFYVASMVFGSVLVIAGAIYL